MNIRTLAVGHTAALFTDVSFVTLDVAARVGVRVAFTDITPVLVLSEAVVTMQVTEHRRALVFDTTTVFASEAGAAVDHRT